MSGAFQELDAMNEIDERKERVTLTGAETQPNPDQQATPSDILRGAAAQPEKKAAVSWYTYLQTKLKD
jgi:hypothetical protein